MTAYRLQANRSARHLPFQPAVNGSFRCFLIFTSGNSFSSKSIFSLAESLEKSFESFSLISLIIFTESNFLVFINYLHGGPDFNQLIPLLQINRIKSTNLVDIHNMLKIPTYYNINFLNSGNSNMLCIKKMIW